MKSLVPVLLLFLIAAAGCDLSKHGADIKPLNTDTVLPASPCPGQLVGLQFPAVYALDTTVNLVGIDKQSAAATPYQSLSRGSSYTNQAVIMDSMYAVLLPARWAGFSGQASVLRFTSLAAGSTFTDVQMGSNTVVSLACRHSTHNFYAVSYGSSGTDSLITFGLNGSTITGRTVVGTFYHNWISPPSLTVNEATGDAYVAGSDVNSYTTIFKYTAGGTVVALPGSSGIGGFIVGLQYNAADNNLYAVRCGTTTGNAKEFLQISPQSGNAAVWLTLPDLVNNEFFSSVIEECSGRYIFVNNWSGVRKLTTVEIATQKVGNTAMPFAYQGIAIRP